MARSSAALVVDRIVLDRSIATPLHRQLREQLRQAISDGCLAPGIRLQSTRCLASELGVSRNTIQNAFNELLADGLLEARTGSGTFVAGEIPRGLPARRQPSCHFPLLSRRGAAIAQARNTGGPSVYPAAPLLADLPTCDGQAAEVWSRLISRVARCPGRLYTRGVDACGYRPLREAIATYLRAARGVECAGEQVFLAHSWRELLAPLVCLLIDPGEPVWVQEPGCSQVCKVLADAGGCIVPVPFDEQGTVVNKGQAQGVVPRLIHVTPAQRRPLDLAMARQRVHQLLDYAGRANAWVVEDDRYGMILYSDRSLPSLQSLDADGRVAYIGSMTRLLFPLIRLEFAVVPATLADSYAAALAQAGDLMPPLEQAVLAEFINEGHLAQHLQRARRHAGRQEGLLITASTGGNLLQEGRREK